MKVKIPKQVDPRVREIQEWMKSYGSNISNAYKVNADGLREAGANQGVIEKVLWRVARENKELALTSETMVDLLSPKKLMREVRKQRKRNANRLLTKF